jgi:hypothetical protein
MKRSIAEEMYDWLSRRLTVDEAEAQYTYDGVPFGAINTVWQKLKAIVLSDPTTELWAFRSPQATWTTIVPRCGWEGYAVLKDGKIVDFILTALS